MKIGDMTRPKGSHHPFQTIKAERLRMYALEYKLGSGWKYRVWYEKQELEVMV